MPRPRRFEPGWIEFPPHWPERDRGEAEIFDEPRLVTLTTPIPRTERDRPKVLRIVATRRPSGHRQGATP